MSNRIKKEGKKKGDEQAEINELMILYEIENMIKRNKELLSSCEKRERVERESIKQVIEKIEEKKTPVVLRNMILNKNCLNDNYVIELPKQIDYPSLFSYLSQSKANTSIYNVYSANTLPYVRDFSNRSLAYEDVKKIMRRSVDSTMLGISIQQDAVMYEQYKLWKVLNHAMDAILYELAKMG